MAHESFENPEIAHLLNENFVCIKVDREERPDIDQVYMTACQSMTGSGGWPLTVLLDSEGRPFFAGTYFTPTHLTSILQQAIAAWKSRRDELNRFAERLTSLIQGQESAVAAEVSHEAVHAAYQQLSQRYDSRYGGFGAAPKFPSPHLLLFLLHYARLERQPEGLRMAAHTLRCMAKGGIQDQIGFGFSRYSTDARWLVPHFEKMLYDNALLTLAYLEAAQQESALEAAFFESVASQILEYLLRDMQSPEGGFYTAEDADSEGEEGLFYLWTPDEVCRVLGVSKGLEVAELLDIREPANFEGRCIPNFIDKELTGDELDLFRAARPKLWEARSQRIRPLRDEKILTAQNGLVIAALARAGIDLGEPTYIQEGVRAAKFVMHHLDAGEGRLYSRYAFGEARYPAHVEDYAFFIWGLLELYRAAAEPQWLEQARCYAQVMLEDFRDPQLGGLFFSSSKAERLIVRQKATHDGAYPSGNSVAADVLQRLGTLLDSEELLEAAAEIRRSFAGSLTETPTAFTWMLTTLMEAEHLSKVVLVGAKRQELEEFRGELLRIAPDLLILCGSEDQETSPELRRVLRNYRPKQDKTTAYLCRGRTCYPPQTDLAALCRMLRE